MGDSFRQLAFSFRISRSARQPGLAMPKYASAGRRLPGCTLIDVETCLKEIRTRRIACTRALGVLTLILTALFSILSGRSLGAQAEPASDGPPPSNGGVFPLSEVHKGLTATAWTVFSGTTPEPMQVEILGVLRGARGPGQDMILAQLHGAKPEYTGVVAGMSGSPVYVGKRLLGSLSYRIGQFSKDPIAGITPIEQMLLVRNLPIAADAKAALKPAPANNANMNFQAMETPLVMSGFHPEAIRLWQQQMAGTGLAMVTAGGIGGSSVPQAPGSSSQPDFSSKSFAAARASIVPGSAVSAQLVRGDVEIAATCTVTYVDPKQLLACGHPILQAGPVSLPMTTTDVVATLASPLNAFKIVNTGQLIGAFTEDRDSAIRGVFAQQPRMIPMHVFVHEDRPAPAEEHGETGSEPMGAAQPDRHLNLEILDLPSLTSQAMLVSLYEALLENNDSTAETSYHLTGSIELAGHSPSALDEWVSASDAASAPLELALAAGSHFARIYSNASRLGGVRNIDLNVEAIPRRVAIELENARLVSSDIVHAGDTVVVEATLRPWQLPARNVRIPIALPARLSGGNVRILVSDAATLDRTLDQPKFSAKPVDLNAVLAADSARHPADRLYVSLLVPEAQAGLGGQTLTSLPLSVANALEPMRTAQDATLNGESAQVAGQVPAGGVLSGFQVLSLHIEPGGSLN